MRKIIIITILITVFILASCKNLIKEQTSPGESCIPNWICTDWSACSSNKKIKECTDTNKCNTDQLTKNEYEECVIEPTRQQPAEQKAVEKKEDQKLKIIAHYDSPVNDPTSPHYRDRYNPKKGVGSQINIRTGKIAGIEVYYENQFQGTTAPIERDEFGYLLDKLAKMLDTGEDHVTEGYHNVYLVKNSVVVFNKTLYVGPQNFTSRGEWIYYNP